MVKFTLHVRPISVNKYYRPTGKYHRTITIDGIAFGEEFQVRFEPYRDRFIDFLGTVHPMERLQISLMYCYPNYYTKAGSISKAVPDVDNPNKPTIDQMFKDTGFDDDMVGRVICENVHAPVEMIKVQITKYLAKPAIPSH